MPSEYYLNGEPLSAFGFVPGHATGSNLALSGAWDMPARSGDTSYTWQETNGIEPYVEEADMLFEARTIKLVGSISASDRTVFWNRLEAFRAFVESLPATFELRCDWAVRTVSRSAEMKADIRGGRVARITLSFTEPAPDLSGRPPVQWILATGVWNTLGTWLDEAPWYAVEEGRAVEPQIDLWSWESFGFIPSGMTGEGVVPTVRSLRVTQPARGATIVAPGGREARELTLAGVLVADDMSDFDRRVRSLYWLFGSAGLRTLHRHGREIDCFARNGFTLTGIQKRERIYAKLNVKLTEVEHG
ncbi:hypothetical protein [uncultured Rikenella sp.]|uniref:hypothetical protein n=1 Tax=uncultured Rikenella sp. TaxID=368003 RepID=UPI002600A509|nr:hypothetical protein [uncultured Rikenella sp.]